MASGEICATIGPFVPPDDDYATEDMRESASTPKDRVRVLDFDGSAIEYMDWMCVLHNYDSGGITINGCVTSNETAASKQNRIGADIRVLETTDDIDTAYTYSFTESSVTLPTTSGQQVNFSINIADETGMSDGGRFILRIRRDPTHADDNTTQDMELWVDSLYITEQ